MSKRQILLYALSIIYVIVTYAFIFISYFVSSLNVPNNLISVQNNMTLFFLFLPIIMCIINYIVIFKIGKKEDSNILLNCSILIKYALIPFFIIGYLLVLMFLLFTFIPVPIMIFVGPSMAIFLSMLGWIILIGSAPFSITYIIKANKEKKHGKVLSIIAIILQFFFALDVLSIMFLTLKEKRWKKLTYTVLALLIILVLLGIIGLNVLIFSYI